MKQSHLLLFFSILVFFACKQDQKNSIDLNTLQKNMNADEEVIKLRTLLYGQTRILATIPPAELENIISKIHGCGINVTTITLPELEKCISGLPSSIAYLECQKQFQQYLAQYKVVEKRFPDFSQLEHKKQSELLIPLDEEEAQNVLNDYLSNRKK